MAHVCGTGRRARAAALLGETCRASCRQICEGRDLDPPSMFRCASVLADALDATLACSQGPASRHTSEPSGTVSAILIAVLRVLERDAEVADSPGSLLPSRVALQGTGARDILK